MRISLAYCTAEHSMHAIVTILATSYETLHNNAWTTGRFRLHTGHICTQVTGSANIVSCSAYLEKLFAFSSGTEISPNNQHY